MRKYSIVLGALAVFGSFAACSDLAEPGPFGGTYTLSGSNGTALPVSYLGGSSAIRGGTLQVVSADSLHLTLVVGEPGNTGELRFGYRYQLQADSILIPFPQGTGGAVKSTAIHLRVGLPLPPSLGFGLVWHDLQFAR